MSDYDKVITTESVKEIRELYLRNLTDEQSDYIKDLKVKFQETRATEAARRALYGFIPMEQRYLKEREERISLQKELMELKANLNQFKAKVSNHFNLEAQVLLSREALLDVIDEPHKAHVVFNPKSSLKAM